MANDVHRSHRLLTRLWKFAQYCQDEKAAMFLVQMGCEVTRCNVSLWYESIIGYDYMGYP